MRLIFDNNASPDSEVQKIVEKFLIETQTLELKHDMPVIVFQDGVNGSYYIRCSILSKDTINICDLNAKLDWSKDESFRANRELHKTHHTYIRMADDASKGREFNDIIVEYNLDYVPEKPLKVWGGQHRISAIIERGKDNDRYHGFKIFFLLQKNQRTELALISNTNINVSNDTFDRMVEETIYGDKLRKWCVLVGLLEKDDNFPDVGSRSENITVKLARSFIVNYYLGFEKGKIVLSKDLDKNYYEPQTLKTGVEMDPTYSTFMERYDIIRDEKLITAGKNFGHLHKTQYNAIIHGKGLISNRKGFRNKALVESVLCGWAYVAGLLQNHASSLENHYSLPKTNKKIPDPLNAKEMSIFKHDSDEKTYRGLGTRASDKDRQRLAQLFLAKTTEKEVLIDKQLMMKAVSQLV
ncbi:hypothetical protein KKB18_00405, partial [bacterium]|nr:hypothetical protein [bacterium]